MVDDRKIIAIGLLTARDLERLGTGLEHVYPLAEAPCFGDLLKAIDEADRRVWEERHRWPRVAIQSNPMPKA